MNKTKFTAIMIAGILVTTAVVYALEKKPIAAVDTTQFVKDTQSSVSHENHLNFIWWIPYEYWQVALDDNTTSESGQKEMLTILKQYSLLAVVQADISTFGAFNFYSKDEVEKNLDIILKAEDGSLKKLIPLKAEDVNSDLQVVLGMFKPILAQAMGNLGQNVHFFVLKDYNSAGTRIIDPYRFGALNFRIGQRAGKLLELQIELPLNSLYVPRKCPNGKDAHVTWKYCPWTGEKLKD